MSTNIAMKSLKAVSDMIQSQAISPVEVTEAVLSRIEADQPKVNAYITVLADQARQDAKKAEAEIARGDSKGALHGVPVALKDLFYTKGIRTTAGSRIMADFVPEFSGTVAERLQAAGIVLMGKTNTHEFAYGPSTESSFFGPTRNPWNTARISGGSSGGSGAAVATGMAYMAMGTDTGGSIRIPACLCGVVGFKPTYGTVSLHGIVPLSQAFDHPGPLARSVADVALTMDVIAGYDEKDPYSTPFDKPLYSSVLNSPVSLKGVKVGVLEGYYWEKVDVDVEKRVRASIEALAALGAEIVPVDIPLAANAQSATSVLMSVESAYNHLDYLNTRPGDYQPDVRMRLEKGLEFTGVDFYVATKVLAEIRAAVSDVLRKVQVLAFPSVPVPAYEINAPTLVTRGKQEPAREMLTRHTRLANLTGGPALNVPCGLTPDGLPCGMMIMGEKHNDVEVLRVGYAYERANPWPEIQNVR